MTNLGANTVIPDNESKMLNVFLTIDTEIWPFSPGWPVQALPSDKTDFSEEIAACLYGKTAQGDYGLTYQTDVLNDHGLKATYFLEPLFADRAGRSHLKEAVNIIQSKGHEVQLHLHTEWLSEISDPTIPGQFKQFMHQFSVDEQTALISKGIRSLQAAGVEKIHVFRAGSYGANRDTLRAALNNDLCFDSSYNPCHLTPYCDISENLLLQPRKINDVWQFPVSIFQDYPNHYRHAQLAACSFNELKTVLLNAWKAGWFSFVIVLHSFELVKKRNAARLSLPDKINIQRFKLLCNFLAANADKFCTTLFSEIDPASIPKKDNAPLVHSHFYQTAWRLIEQSIGRLI